MLVYKESLEEKRTQINKSTVHLVNVGNIAGMVFGKKVPYVWYILDMLSMFCFLEKYHTSSMFWIWSVSAL